MIESNVAESRTLPIDRLRLFELVTHGLTHEISNSNQSILLCAQVLLEIVAGIKRITDHYYEEHGDFVVGGIQYSTVKDELLSYVTDVLHSAENIQRSVSELGKFARPAILQSQSVSLNRAVETAATLLANLIRKTTGRFTLELAPGLPEIDGNPQWVLQAILYLILNVCQSVEDRTEPLQISTRHHREEGVVVCEATCGGAHAGDEEAQDAGNEWSTVRRTMEQLGGTLELKGASARPTGAVLRLPVPERIP